MLICLGTFDSRSSLKTFRINQFHVEVGHFGRSALSSMDLHSKNISVGFCRMCVFGRYKAHECQNAETVKRLFRSSTNLRAVRVSPRDSPPTGRHSVSLEATVSYSSFFFLFAHTPPLCLRSRVSVSERVSCSVRAGIYHVLMKFLTNLSHRL